MHSYFYRYSESRTNSQYYYRRIMYTRSSFVHSEDLSCADSKTSISWLTFIREQEAFTSYIFHCHETLPGLVLNLIMFHYSLLSLTLSPNVSHLIQWLAEFLIAINLLHHLLVLFTLMLAFTFKRKHILAVQFWMTHMGFAPYFTHSNDTVTSVHMCGSTHFISLDIESLYPSISLERKQHLKQLSTRRTKQE